LKEAAASTPSGETTVDSSLSLLKIDEKRDPVCPCANQTRERCSNKHKQAWCMAPRSPSSTDTNNAQTNNEQGVTIVPLDVRILESGEVYIRAKDPAYATPGPDESQKFGIE
jgi:hypothetical protein